MTAPLLLCLVAAAAAHELADDDAQAAVQHSRGTQTELLPEASAGFEEDTSSKTNSILQAMWESIERQLDKGIQWVNGLVATIFALVMIFDGEFVFKYVVVAAISIFCYLFARVELDGALDLGNTKDLVLSHIVAAEVAIASAIVAYKGYAGIQILLGLIVGGVIFFYLQDTMKANDALKGMIASHIVAVILGNLCVLLGLAMFLGRMHKRVLAIVSSICGGGLLAASGGFFLEFFCVYNTGTRNYLVKSGFELPTVCPTWESFMKALISRRGKEVGLLVSKYNMKVGGSEIYLDRWIGYTFWFIFTIIGYCIQVRKEKRKSSDGADTKRTRGVKVAAPEDAETGSRVFFSNEVEPPPSTSVASTSGSSRFWGRRVPEEKTSAPASSSTEGGSRSRLAGLRGYWKRDAKAPLLEKS